MPTSRTQTQHGPLRWVFGAVGLVIILGVTLSVFLSRTPAPSRLDPARVAAEADADEILKTCAGGISGIASGEVKAGLAEFLTTVRGSVNTAHSDIGAVIQKVSSSPSGVELYRQYSDCINMRTALKLWPDGNVPPVYRSLLPPAPPPPPPPSLAADVGYLRQTLIEHGKYADVDLFRKTPFKAVESLDFPGERLMLIDSRIPDDEFRPDGTINPPTNMTYNVKVSDLSPLSTVVSVDSDSSLQFECKGHRSCISVQPGTAMGKGAYEPTGQSMAFQMFSVRLSSVTADQILAFQRAMARVIDPTNGDAQVCQAAAEAATVKCA